MSIGRNQEIREIINVTDKPISMIALGEEYIFSPGQTLYIKNDVYMRFGFRMSGIWPIESRQGQAYLASLEVEEESEPTVGVEAEASAEPEPAPITKKQRTRKKRRNSQ